MGFVVYEVALGQIYLPVLLFPVSIMLALFSNAIKRNVFVEQLELVRLFGPTALQYNELQSGTGSVQFSSCLQASPKTVFSVL
jgi:hypothetical protein